MDKVALIFAKLAGLQKNLQHLSYEHDKMFGVTSFFCHEIKPIYNKVLLLQSELKDLWPEVVDDLEPITLELEGRTIHGVDVTQLRHRIDYLLEVRSQAQIGAKVEDQTRPKRIFLTHGTSQDWLKVQAYLEKDLKYQTLELAQEPNLGRTVLQKLSDESSRCSYAVIVMTGDDKVDDQVRARENVIHEIGFFQSKFGLRNVALLHEDGVNIPSNIHGLVYIPFQKESVETSFSGLARELKTWQ